MQMPAEMAKAIEGAHHAPGNDQPAKADHPCMFAAAAAPLQAPATAAIVPPLVMTDRPVPVLGKIVTVGRGLAAPPPPATGPPAIS